METFWEKLFLLIRSAVLVDPWPQKRKTKVSILKSKNFDFFHNIKNFSARHQIITTYPFFREK